MFQASRLLDRLMCQSQVVFLLVCLILLSAGLSHKQDHALEADCVGIIIPQMGVCMVNNVGFCTRSRLRLQFNERLGFKLTRILVPNSSSTVEGVLSLVIAPECAAIIASPVARAAVVELQAVLEVNIVELCNTDVVSSVLNPTANIFVPSLKPTYKAGDGSAIVWTPSHLPGVCDLTSKWEFWRQSLGEYHDKDFLLDGILNGFKITDCDLTMDACCRSNYRSALSKETRDNVEAEIQMDVIFFVMTNLMSSLAWERCQRLEVVYI